MNPAPSHAAPVPTGAAIGCFCVIGGGLALADQVSSHLLPLTARQFTADAATIGIVLAIHPACGLLVQPVVGALGDRWRAPLGRRAFFLAVAAPLGALCLAALPHAESFAGFVALVTLFQFFLAVLWGAYHPLLAELVPVERRTFAKGCLMVTTNVAAFAFLKAGLGWVQARFGAAGLCAAVAAALALLAGGAALVLHERPVAPAPRPPLSAWRYVADFFGDPLLRRFGLLAFLQAAFLHSVIGFAALFAVQTLAIAPGEFGHAWSLKQIAAVALAIPAGLAVERLPKPRVLVAGYTLGLGACALGWAARDADDFVVAALALGLGHMLVSVTQKPFFTEHLPPDITGQLSGAYNLCYASGRIVALVAGGQLVAACGNDYRAIWPLALGFGATAAVVAATLTDARHRARAAQPAAAALGPAPSA